MLWFTSLASSSAGNAYRLSGGGARQPILIDCGVPFKQLQKMLNFRVTDLAGALISHYHMDHCKAVPDLLRSGIECMASRETWEALAPKDYKYYCGVLVPHKVMKVGDWEVMPFETVHDVEGALGFVIGSPDGERLLYLTDSNYSKFKFEGLTHICIEANHSMEIMRENASSGRIDPHRFERTAKTHFSIERVIDFLKAIDLSRAQRIFLLHLSRENSDAAAFKIMVEKATGIPTTVCDERSAAV